ncbi:E3 ubiquitin-protein ligase TRIM71-like isoform X4 [Bolinopsis microptera]|uniref:E3 ubiquitin-protein ligase TRIM71-like isoform X4 n=1 Tax=Bolinopsis microptera TaxID=2820187 RepID=UPI00307A0BEA
MTAKPVDMAASPSEIGMLSRSAAVTSSFSSVPGEEKVDNLLTEKVTKEITCNPCGKVFRYGIRTPRILPCLHTSCERCLKPKSSSGRDSKNCIPEEELVADELFAQPRVTCPICRKESDVPGSDISKLPMNYYAVKLLELIDYFKLERKGRLPCIGCTEPAHWRCIECDENYCQDHSDFHHKSRATCDHRILTFKQILLSPRSLSTMRNQYCTTHNNKPLEIFCKDCNRAICTLCAVTQHKTHETREVAEAVAALKAKVDALKPQISMSLYSLRQALTRVKTAAREVNVDSQVSSRKVSGMIEVCISAVREKERELVSDLEKKKRQNTEIINSQKELLEGELSSMQTGREFVERAFIGSEVEVLCLEPQIVAKMDELISGDCPTINSEVDRIGFTPSGHDHILKAIEVLGKVGPPKPDRGPRMVVDDNGDLVLLDNKGNVIRGETKELLRLLKQNIIEEELRVDEEERKRLQEEEDARLAILREDEEARLAALKEEAARLKALEPPRTPTPLPPRDFTVPINFSRTFGSQGNETGMYSGPVGMCITDKNYIAICDVHNNRIQVVKPDGTYVLGFGVTGTAVGELNGPNDICMFNNRNFIIADTYNDRIQLFAPTGRFIRTIGQKARRRAIFNIPGSQKKPDAMEGIFEKPFGVCVNSKLQILVSDMGNHRIQVFERNGDFCRQIGVRGDDPGQLMYPYGIAVDSLDNIYVCDLGNHRVQKYNSEGRFLKQIGHGKGESDGCFMQPRSVAVDIKTGCVSIVDTALHRVQVFTSEGQFLNKFGSRGNYENKFSSPCGITTNFDGEIFVSDFRNNRIHVL